MITSNQSYGVDLKKIRASELGKSFDQHETSSSTEEKNSPFAYSKESDRIGEGVSVSQSPFSKITKAKLKRKNQYVCPRADKDVCNTIRETEFLSYEHNPKKQNPLFTTTANEIGLVKPVEVLYTNAKYARKQSFSNQFNGIMYRNEGLRF